MKETNEGRALPTGRERVSFTTHARTGYRSFSFFLMLCAVLVAAFGVGALIGKVGGEGALLSAETEGEQPDGTTSEAPLAEAPLPKDAVRVVSMDLSRGDLGESYLHNQTPYAPSVEELLTSSAALSSEWGEGRVLILHTHTSEGYLEGGCDYVEGSLGEATYSRDEEKNVLAVGRALCDALKKRGITALHCTVMHDDPSLRDSYERAAKTVQRYMEEYPDIVCVIDLHRDAVLTSGGEYVRTLATGVGQTTAQIMAVVGSDCNGTPHGRWEENLALALQLRQACNQRYPTLCRPVSLRASSYNQELAPYFLLLEIGSGGNSVEEAVRAAELFAEVLADLVNGSDVP